MKDLYTGKYKTVIKKKIKEDTNKTFFIHRLKTMLLKWPYYPKQSADSMQSLSVPMMFFTEIEKVILIFIWNHKRPQITKTILRKSIKLKALSSLKYTRKLQ